MKNKIDVEKTIIVTKDNFQSSLKEFKDIIKSNLFDYIIINNDISTSNPKIQNKEGEIVFSEFTLCKNVNYERKDINYTFTTFLVPSIKFHRYAVDEISSFSSIFMKYLTNEKSVYDFNLINSPDSLSYDNIHRRAEFEKNLNLILKRGKPFKKENKTSYYYYPKAFELPSRKYQKQFENYIEYFLSQNFDKDAKKIENEDKDKSTFMYDSDKYVSDFKFLNNFLDFKWGQIFEKIDSDMYKIFVDEFKIKFTSQIEICLSFLKFVENLKQFFENEKSIDSFDLELAQEEENQLNVDFFKNWKKYIMSEENVAEFSYEFTGKNKIKFILKADKPKEKNKFQSLMKFLAFILSVPNEINNKKEFQIKQIYFRRINMRNLFPEKIRNNIEFYYHLISKVDKEKFNLEKSKEYYLSKISYQKLFVSNKNEEEILFGYRLDSFLRNLLESKDMEKAKEDLNKDKDKTISLEFGKDLELLLKDDKIMDILKTYYSKIFVKIGDENIKFRTVHYKMIKIPNYKDKNYQKDLESLLHRAKEIKKNLLLDEEIGVTFFYDTIFKKEGINIYGTNLKNKIYFPIKQLLLEPNKNNEEEIQKILEKVNIYDISYICKKENIDFFQKYLKLKKDEELKERTITQRLGYVIEEIEKLNNRENLSEYKNKFYLDEKDKITKKNYICIDKNKFYGNAENIIKIFQDKTDFTITKNVNNNTLEFNVIDPTKKNEIEDLEKEIISNLEFV